MRAGGGNGAPVDVDLSAAVGRRWGVRLLQLAAGHQREQEGDASGRLATTVGVDDCALVPRSALVGVVSLGWAGVAFGPALRLQPVASAHARYHFVVIAS